MFSFVFYNCYLNIFKLCYFKNSLLEFWEFKVILFNFKVIVEYFFFINIVLGIMDVVI